MAAPPEAPGGAAEPAAAGGADGAAAVAPLPGVKRVLVDIAPAVADHSEERALQPLGCSEVRTNLQADEMYAPVMGPANPWRAKDAAHRNSFFGSVDETNMNEFVFRQEFHRRLPYQFEDWKQKRTAPDPKRLRRDWEEAKLQKQQEADAQDAAPAAAEDGEAAAAEGAAAAAGGALVVAPGGQVAKQGAAGAAAAAVADEFVEGHNMYFEEDRKGNRTHRVEAIRPEVTMHLRERYDYQGRSLIMHNPLKAYRGTCTLPKRLVHTFRGHNKGVQCVRWMPPLGHLFASGGLDGKVKLWDVLRTREVVQTYIGHFRGIKDLNFDNTGERFVSSGYDNFIRVWDTETGSVLHTLTNGTTANVVKFHPSDDKPDQLFAGCADKQLHQFDLRSGRIVQSYDQHLGAINTVTFVDNNRRIVTTSDDKTMRVWEMDLPVPIKHVMDPSMHSMPAATIHPSHEWFGLQSMDNQVLIYSATDRFKLNKRKRFVGHVVAGYACEPGFSPDGKFVSSGNGQGELYIWSWGSTKIAKHFKCHSKVLLSHLWHPTAPSTLLTSSWDSEIKLWD
eukprot:TRINITY_DN2073_c0_g3_i1.p1 TRINITY_DN2073_c0_g3~~TRINITY_DN2073_c0_g3_i1.p1  ORF type:complete len:562 (+),score=217.41 TRINITY_DN2073_c0_g3_i1:79-1764(+)